MPDAAVGSSRLDLTTIWSYPGGARTFLGYQCQAAFAIESTNLDDLQQLLVDLVAAGAMRLTASTSTSPTNQNYGRRQNRAVAAARSKAQLYAEAAAVRLGAVVHIDDVDPEQPGVEGYRGHGHAAVPEAASEQELAPGHVVVSAAVILGFAIVTR